MAKTFSVGATEKCCSYDAVLSLGRWCATAIALRKLGLRSASGPFDWLLGKDRSVRDYVDLIISGFNGFLRLDNLRSEGAHPEIGRHYYADTATSFVFRHDFTAGVKLEDEYPIVRAKYDRRIVRMLKTLRSPGRVLLVHYCGEGHEQPEEIVSAIRDLRANFTESTLDLLVLENDSRTKSPIRHEIGHGVLRFIGDFYDPARYDAVMGNERLVLEVLKEIRLKGRWHNLLRNRVDSFKRRLKRLRNRKYS